MSFSPRSYGRRSFDRGGALGLAAFIIPLILDGIFHGALPQLFAPNTLAMLQKPDISFARIRWRKRADRAAQLVLLAGLATAAARLASTALRLALRALPVGAPRALASALPIAATAGAAAVFLRRKMGSDVADVLAGQTSDDSKNGEGTRPGY